MVGENEPRLAGPRYHIRAATKSESDIKEMTDVFFRSESLGDIRCELFAHVSGK